MIRCSAIRTEARLCVIESGPIAYEKGPLGPACTNCQRLCDAINHELAARGFDPVVPDWPAYQRTSLPLGH